MIDHEELTPDPELTARFARLASIEPDDLLDRIDWTIAPRCRPAGRRIAMVGSIVGIAAAVTAVVVITDPSVERRISTDSVAVSVATAPSPDPTVDGQPDATISEASEPSSGSAPSPAAPDEPVTMVDTIEPSPLAPRAGSATTAVGDTLLVWGGTAPNAQDGSEPPFTDGARWSRADRTWQPIAPSPLPGGASSAVALGDRAVVLNDGRLATYSPTDDTWIELTPPVLEGLERLVVTGGRVVVLPAGIAWDGFDWTTLSPTPTFGVWSWSTVADDDQIIVWGPIEGGTSGRGWRYDVSADVWTELPPAPLTQVYDSPGVLLIGRHLVVATWLDLGAATLDLDTMAWERLPDLPVRPVICRMSTAPIDETTGVVSMCGSYGVIDLRTRSWSVLRSPVTMRIGSFDDLLALGTDRVLDGAVIVPGAFWTDAAAMGPVPIGELDLEREHVVGIRADGEVSRVMSIVVTLDTGCTVTTLNGAPPGALTLDAAIAADRVATRIDFRETYNSNGFRLDCPDRDALDASASMISWPYASAPGGIG
jgi:hypothetical protein